MILLVPLALALPARARAQDADTIPDPAAPEVVTIPDPVRAFIEGFNPEDEDFFAHPPERTDLHRHAVHPISPTRHIRCDNAQLPPVVPHLRCA